MNNFLLIKIKNKKFAILINNENRENPYCKENLYKKFSTILNLMYVINNI